MSVEERKSSSTDVGRWYDDKTTAVPPAFAGISNYARPVLHKDGLTVTYKKQHMTTKEYKTMIKQWQIDYPHITYSDVGGKQVRTKHETQSFRTSTTTNKKIRLAVWDKLPWISEAAWTHLEEGFKVPETLKRLFKVDMYGNVIAKEADNMSLCYFDVDHIFPWSRGGRSVPENFAAVQWDCNRIVKKDRFHQSLTDDQCLVGLRLSQLAALVPMMIGRTMDEKAQKQNVLGWLTKAPIDTGRALTSFNKKWCTSNEREEIRNFFEGREDEDRAILRKNVRAKEKQRQEEKKKQALQREQKKIDEEGNENPVEVLPGPGGPGLSFLIGNYDEDTVRKAATGKTLRNGGLNNTEITDILEQNQIKTDGSAKDRRARLTQLVEGLLKPAAEPVAAPIDVQPNQRSYAVPAEFNEQEADAIGAENDDGHEEPSYLFPSVPSTTTAEGTTEGTTGATTGLTTEGTTIMGTLTSPQKAPQKVVAPPVTTPTKATTLTIPPTPPTMKVKSFKTSSKNKTATTPPPTTTTIPRCFKVVVKAGVALRNSPSFDDRCAGCRGPEMNECVRGTVVRKSKWICVVSADQRKHGKYLPIVGRNGSKIMLKRCAEPNRSSNLQTASTTRSSAKKTTSVTKVTLKRALSSPKSNVGSPPPAPSVATIRKMPRSISQQKTTTMRKPVATPDTTRKGAIYLKVAYAEKDTVKKMGAKWDRERKSWFVPLKLFDLTEETLKNVFEKWYVPSAKEKKRTKKLVSSPSSLKSGSEVMRSRIEKRSSKKKKIKKKATTEKKEKWRI